MESLTRLKSILDAADKKTEHKNIDLRAAVQTLCNGYSDSTGTVFQVGNTTNSSYGVKVESGKRIKTLVDAANAKTGKTDRTLTSAVQHLCDGYKSSTPIYSFGAVSDTHIQYGGTESDGDYNGVNDLQRALTYFDDKVEFVCICGDLVAWASEEYMTQYKNVIEDTTLTTKPIYECTGNHETYPASGVTGSIDKTLWETTTGWANHAANNCVGDSLYYYFTHGNDVFIMFSVKTVSPSATFEDGALEWLENVLEENRNKRCFIFQHIHDENDSAADPSHRYSDMLNGEHGYRFLSLMRHYKNCVWFHGHTHKSIDWDVNDGIPTPIADYPVSTNLGYKSVHIPSLQGSRYYDSASNNIIVYYYKYNSNGEIITDSSGKPIKYQGGNHAEGYIVDVYEDKIVMRGIDFAVLNYTADWEAYYTVSPMEDKVFAIDTTLQTIEAGTYEYNA